MKYDAVAASLESEPFGRRLPAWGSDIFTCALRTIFFGYITGLAGDWLIAIFYNEAGNGWLEREDLNHTLYRLISTTVSAGSVASLQVT